MPTDHTSHTDPSGKPRSASTPPARTLPEGRPPPSQDFQSLLGQAVERLASDTRFTRVAAWGPGKEGEPMVLAARIEGAVLGSPNAPAFEALANLAGPVDLGDDPALAQLAGLEGFRAAAPIRAAGQEGPAYAVFLIGGEPEPPARMRPRTLAVLGSAAERLRGPVAVALAAERLQFLDQEIRQLDRLASLGSLVAEIVHEIRNPLVSVKTFLQLLPERDDDPEFTESFLEVARDELQRIERLLNLVLQHGRPSQKERSDGVADLQAGLDSVLQLVRFRADERQVHLETSFEEELPKLQLGPDGLRQALLNLAINAIEATPTNGTVTLRAAAGQGCVEICVDDEGPGIPEERRAQLLTPFYSTKTERPGGLGLSITARIIDEAGGQLEIEHAPAPAGASSNDAGAEGRGTPRGARFRVRLPNA